MTTNRKQKHWDSNEQKFEISFTNLNLTRNSRRNNLTVKTISGWGTICDFFEKSDGLSTRVRILKPTLSKNFTEAAIYFLHTTHKILFDDFVKLLQLRREILDKLPFVKKSIRFQFEKTKSLIKRLSSLLRNFLNPGLFVCLFVWLIDRLVSKLTFSFFLSFFLSFFFKNISHLSSLQEKTLSVICNRIESSNRNVPIRMEKKFEREGRRGFFNY